MASDSLEDIINRLISMPPSPKRKDHPNKFRPQCTHLNMVRLYGEAFKCDHCHKPGSFGWVYRCCQDREEIIEFSVSQGCRPSFDALGDFFSERLHLRKRSPVARADMYCFFKEQTPESMALYQPEQIVQILEQRRDLNAKIDADMRSGRGPIPIAGIFEADGLISRTAMNSQEARQARQYHSQSLNAECDYQICPRCRPGAASRAYQSLNAVADGEIMPTAATGWGFHHGGARPVKDARIVRNIGLRYSVMESPVERSNADVLEVIQRQLSKGEKGQVEMEEPKLPKPIFPPAGNDETQKRLKHSPRYENLAVFSEPNLPADPATQPPFTPPPSPSLVELRQYVEGIGQDPSTSDGGALLRMDENVAGEQLMEEASEELEKISTQRDSLTPAPLRLREGVSMLEESTEAGVPDLIKQV